MKLGEPIAIAVLQLWSNKVRSLLTILGILIGVGSVVAVMSLGDGLRRTVLGELDRLGGGRLIMVQGPQLWIRQGARWVRRPWDDYLANDDVERIRRESRYAASVLPMSGSQGALTYKRVETSGRLQGTSARYADAIGWRVDKGRFLQPSEIDERARVCVLGATLAKELFGREEDPLDKLIRLNGERFRVVGVMVEKRLFGDDWGRYIFIPVTTLQSRITGDKRLGMLLVHARSIEETPLAAAEVRSILRRYHKHGDKFQVRDVGEDLEKTERVFFILKAVVGGIAGVSLLVGGIGIMNIMLVSVAERTREIGIRKAIGAQPAHIMTQFLVESVALSVFGGLVGLVFGLGLGYGGAAIISKASGDEFVSVVSANAVVIAIGFSAAVGIFFGVYPALRAARMDPVEALRYE